MDRILLEIGFSCLVAVLIIDKIVQWLRPSPVNLHVVYSVGTQTEAERKVPQPMVAPPPSEHPPSYEDLHRVRRSPVRARRNEPRTDERGRQTPLNHRACLFCRMQSHGPLECPTYPTAEQRANILRSRGACTQCCLVHPHNIPGRGCPETRRMCGTCRPPHIDWLCPNRRKPSGVYALANVALLVAGAIIGVARVAWRFLRACAQSDRNNSNNEVAAAGVAPEEPPEIQHEETLRNNEE